MYEATHRVCVPGSSSAEAEHLLPLGKGGCVSHCLGISDANIWGEEILWLRSPLAQTQLLPVHVRLSKLLTDLQHQSNQKDIGKGGPRSLVLQSSVNTHNYEIQTLC